MALVSLAWLVFEVDDGGRDIEVQVPYPLFHNIAAAGYFEVDFKHVHPSHALFTFA